MMFMTVKEPINLGAPDKDASGLTAVIKSLTEKGLAELWRLEKLSRDEVASGIGQAAPGIAAKLHGVTGGNARWVRELWREWRQNEIVVTDEADRWVWSHHRETTMNLYEDILEARLKHLLKVETALEVEQAQEVLACAALEGEHFTAEAVALALGWERDKLLDFLDEVLVQTDENPDGLLLEDESVSIPTPNGATRTLWRYRFVSDLHWMAMERYGFSSRQRPGKGDTERLEKSIALAKALIEIYAQEERFVAAPLSRLLHEIGNKEEAKHYQRMADYAAGREVMREQALYLMTLIKDDWEQWQFAGAVKFLIEAGTAMTGAFPHHETLSVFEVACELAAHTKDQYNKAWAHYHCGFILQSEGEYKAGRARAIDSLDIFLRIQQKSGIAASLNLLAQIDHAEDKYDEGRERTARALEIDREIGDRQGEAVSLNLLARIDDAEGKYDEGRERAAQALEICREIGDRKGEAISLYILGFIASEFERINEALILVTFSTLVFTQLGDANAKDIESTLAKIFDKHNYSNEQQQEIFNQVSAAYEKDGGKELIEYALARLQEANN